MLEEEYPFPTLADDDMMLDVVVTANGHDAHEEVRTPGPALAYTLTHAILVDYHANPTSKSTYKSIHVNK